MKQNKQKLYQVGCECGSYHWVKKRKQNTDIYKCVGCGLEFKVRDTDRYLYAIRGYEVVKKNE